LDRAHRLAQFYRLSDEAERREAIQTTGNDYYGDSGAAEVCANGLKQLGVFAHPEWWDHLPDEDLQEQQREELREDVYHQLLLLGVIRAKRGAQLLGKQEATAFFQSGLEALQAANRFRPESYSGQRMEAMALFATGHSDQIKRFTVDEPSSATDY